MNCLSNEMAAAEYCTAKTAKKVAETELQARRAGEDLLHAVQQMRHRAEEEEREDQHYYIDDLITPPQRFSEHLTVRVSYRWRPMIEGQWQHGSIIFAHDVDIRQDYTMPLPKRKPTIRKQEMDRQDKLCREWDHLRQLGLHSVKEFFRAGGNAMSIPPTFRAKADSHARGLNNFSAQFWSANL